jgi:hypothetical protein
LYEIKIIKAKLNSQSPLSPSTQENAVSNSPPTALLNAHPVDLVIAICGSDSISVKGFGQEKMMPSWVRPGVRFVAANETSSSLTLIELERKRMTNKLRTAAACLSLLAAAFAGFWASTAFIGGELELAQQGPQALNWSVTSIEDGSVTITHSTQDAEKVESESRVKVGSALPNGEILRFTSPGTYSYATNRASITIGAPHPATPSSRNTAPAVNEAKGTSAAQVSPAKK